MSMPHYGNQHKPRSPPSVMITRCLEGNDHLAPPCHLVSRSIPSPHGKDTEASCHANAADVPDLLVRPRDDTATSYLDIQANGQQKLRLR
ncbi:hypothetical protein LSAT2_003707 [Lamellibrachia satsuma]|nr:hypothetical protein LSAT2_003707 [Lamellibrachia satsuma]